MSLLSCKTRTNEITEKKPNIILIMADDLGYETIGAYGGSSYQTPNLDLLANEGIRFDHCYSTPLCTPSRVQIMTGKYNFRNYIGFGLLDPNEKTVGHYMQEAGYSPDIFLESINSFMEKNEESPFFVYYPMALAHDPFVPTPHNQKFNGFDATSKTNDPLYFGEMVQYMDMIVGKIVAKTEELGIRENTVIIFIGDNGTDQDVVSIVNGHSLRGDKGNTTDAGTHVPLIVNWKGKIAPKSTNDNLIDFTDFLPTLLDFSGTKPLNSEALDGLSFYQQLLGDNSNKRDWIFCHYAPNWGQFKPKRYVQNKKWKLYDNGELYNLEQDIAEENSLQPANYPKEQEEVITTFKRVLNQYK